MLNYQMEQLTKPVTGLMSNNVMHSCGWKSNHITYLARFSFIRLFGE